MSAPIEGGTVSGNAVGTAPAVSVVIACYNGEQTLADQLEALCRQDFAGRFEVVVADNGSTDGSADLARGYVGRLDLRVVDASAVKGPAYARNTGVEATSAPLIAFCDADDIVADDWLSALVRALHVDSFVAGKVDVERLNSSRVRRSRTMRQTGGLQRSATAGGLPHAGAGNMGVRRSVFEGVDGFDLDLRCLQDSDLCWRIQLAGTPLVYHPEMLLYTRLRSTWRTMARQGYLYGRSFAQLEGRYRALGVGDAPRASERRSHLRTLAAVLRAQGLAGLVWEVSWLVGHRQADGIRLTTIGDGPPQDAAAERDRSEQNRASTDAVDMSGLPTQSSGDRVCAP